MFSEKVIIAIGDIKHPCVNLLAKRNALLNLIFMQQVMVASCDLLETAMSSLTDEKFDRILHAYYKCHLEEERGHAEWLANDLMTSDVDVAAIPLARKAVEIAGTQYYLIRHVHPVALLGYMAVLEGAPMPLEVVSALEKEHGKELYRTLRYHAEHDLYHRSELFEMIDVVPDKHKNTVLNSAMQTAIYLAEVAQEWQT